MATGKRLQSSLVSQSLPLPNKTLGQHWLSNADALEDICDMAAIESGESVLEIGPGPGTLTRYLLKKAHHVFAVEFDEKLAIALNKQNKNKRLTVIHQDIMSFDLTKLPENYIVVANIPYYLTSALVRLLSESSNPPSRVVLLVQKEVAERLAAPAGKTSLLSITAQYYWTMTLGNVVPAELFSPPPKVDSQIILFERRSESLFQDVNTAFFFQIVKAGFSARRKTLLNSLSGGLRKDKPDITRILTTAGIDSSRRPQELTISDWYAVYQSLC
ncbi:MAG: 16S rRNA (adenine(1518)-N(6)/adenine(1519)-N(6)) -dimethyltransferase RsmA [Candidatus Saccharimonadales bacterium]